MPPEPLRVLLLEPDDAEARDLARELADPGGAQVLTRVAGLGPAIERMAEESFHLLLIGRRAGGTSGAVLAAVRRAFPDLPALALIGAHDEEARRRLLREGVQEVLLVEHLDCGQTCGAAALVQRAIRHLCERAELRVELERARQLGLHLAHHDTLTDLPNRQLFRTRLRQLIAQARRDPRALAVLFLDLDRFKEINDTLGHRVGDLLLVAVARRIESCVRETDTAARRGGDEFTIILDGIRRAHDAAKVARKVITELARPFSIEGHELFVSASIGISLFPTDGADVETLLRSADIAMYRAKARGGNDFQFFLPEMNDRALDRMEFEHSLRQALERGSFVLHYQPQVDLASGRIVSMEALVRWQHPDLGLIHPDEFIPLAEETGLIVPLGEWVLDTACRQARAWRERDLGPVALAVNFSARQFQFRRPVERIRQALESSGLAAEDLELELTESAVMKDPTFAIETLRKLRGMGVRISIDDFGTGHSSLAYLKRFPISKLKIDKAFIRTIRVDPKDAAITQAIIAMAHSLGLKAVAEGVETAEQLELLRGPACDEVQGYLFSRPLPAAEATRLLSNWTMPAALSN